MTATTGHARGPTVKLSQGMRARACAGEAARAIAALGRTLADWASDLGDIAERGLKACLPDDIDKITPLLERIEAGRSPADDLLDAWASDPSPANVIAAVAY